MVSVRCGGAMANSARNFIRFCCCLLLLFDQSAMVSGRFIRVPTSILSQTAISNPGESIGKGPLQKAETLTENGLFTSNGTNFGDQAKTVPLVNSQQKAPNSVGGDGNKEKGPPEQTIEGANIPSINLKDSSSASKTEEANQQGSQTALKESAATVIRGQTPVKTQTVVDQQRKGDVLTNIGSTVGKVDESAGTKMTTGRSIDNSKANLGADGISSPLRGQRERGTSSTTLTNKEGISQPKSAADNVDVRKGSTLFGGPNEVPKPTADSVAEPKGKGTAVAELVSQLNGRIPSKKSDEPGPNGRRRSKSAEQGDAGEPSIEELEKQVEELDEKIKRVNEMLESSKGKKAQARSQKKLQNEIENLEKGEEKEIQFLAGWVSKLAEQKRELEQKLKGKKADKVEGRQALKKVKAEQEEVEEAQEEAVRGEQFLLEKEKELKQEQEEKQKPQQRESTVPKPATTTKADEPASKDQPAPAAAADANGSATRDGKKEQQQATLLASSPSDGSNSKADNDGKIQQGPGSAGQQQQTANGESPGKTKEVPTSSSSSSNNNNNGQSAKEEVPKESVKKMETEKTMTTGTDATKDGTTANIKTDPAQKVAMNKPQESLTATNTGNGNGGTVVKSKPEETNNNRKTAVGSKSAAAVTGQKDNGAKGVIGGVTGTETNNKRSNKAVVNNEDKATGTSGNGSGGKATGTEANNNNKKRNRAASKGGAGAKKRKIGSGGMAKKGPANYDDSDSDSEEEPDEHTGSHATAKEVADDCKGKKH